MVTIPTGFEVRCPAAGIAGRIRIAAAAASLVAALLPVPAAGQEILPFSEIKPGMKGTGRTVFSGTRIEEFQVEVLGTLEKVAAQRNLILVRLSGGPLQTTGVLSGMSGSPIYIGDRLAGAVAYTWGFAKEPVAGVTPIQEMLTLGDRDGPAGEGRARGALPSGAGPAGLAFLRDPAKIAAHFEAYFGPPGEAGTAVSGPVPIGTPLLFSGFPKRAIDLLAPALLPVGLIPVQGGAASRPAAGAERLRAGAGVGVKLARGDVEIAAVCTVTHIEGDRLLACGHPLLNLGPTDLIMTSATVNGLFPSLQESFKFASAGEEIGAFRQDRATGLFGYIGKKARLIPVRLELQSDKGRTRRYAFDVVADPFLGPYVLYAALNGILSSEEKDYGDVSLSYKEGSTIRIGGEENIALKNLFSGDSPRLYASGTVAFLTQILLNNEYRPVHIEGINLILGYSEERRTARVERAWVNRDRVRPGDTIQVSASLKPFRGPAVTRQINIRVPEESPPGPLLLQVGDGLTLARTESESENHEFAPRDLPQLIWLINRLRSNNTIYVVLTRGDNGILFHGERLPNLPPSVARVMARPQTRGNYIRLQYRGVAEEALETEYALTGYKQIAIEVED